MHLQGILVLDTINTDKSSIYIHCNIQKTYCLLFKVSFTDFRGLVKKQVNIFKPEDIRF